MASSLFITGFIYKISMKGSQLLSFCWDCSTNQLIKIRGSVLLFHNPELYLPCPQRIIDRITSDFVFIVLLPTELQMNCCFIVTCDVMATQGIKLHWPNCWLFNILQHNMTGPHYFLTVQIISLLKCIRQTASNISTCLEVKQWPTMYFTKQADFIFK